MTYPGRRHDVTGLTIPELDRARRDLAASLALSRPGSPAREIIAAHLTAVDTERAQRPTGNAGDPGQPPASVTEPAGDPSW